MRVYTRHLQIEHISAALKLCLFELIRTLIDGRLLCERGGYVCIDDCT